MNTIDLGDELRETGRDLELALKELRQANRHARETILLLKEVEHESKMSVIRKFFGLAKNNTRKRQSEQK